MYMDHNKGREVLLEVADILDNYFIPFFLIQGTALGAYRDKGFTPTEKDIDLGVLYENFHCQGVSLTREFLLQGFDIEMFVAPFTRPRTIVLWKNNVHVDIVSFAKWKDKRFCASPVREWITPPYCLVHKAEVLEQYDTIQLFGRRFYLPSPIEYYLTNEYDDWQTPREDHVSRTRVYDYIKQEGIPRDLLENPQH